MPLKSNNLSIRHALLEWSKTTKLPIITKIIDSKSNTIIKYVYSIILIILTIAFIQRVSMLTINYFNFEKMTNIQINKIVNETDFPTVTIRFNNWLNYYHFINYSGQFLANQEDLIQTSNNISDLTEDLLNAKKRFLTSYVLGPLTSDQKHLLETELANQSVISCYFNEQSCLKQIKMNKYENEPAFIQFKTNKKANKFSTLNMELFTGLSETQSPTMSIDSGIVLFIHDDPRLIIMSDEQGIQLRPGYHSSLIISKKVVKTLSEPFNYCVITNGVPPGKMQDKSLFDLTFNLTGFYSQKYCFELCYQTSMIRNCGCYDKNVIKYKNYNNNLESCSEKFSDNETTYLDDEDYLLSCPYLIKESFYASDYVHKCASLCPKECELKTFKTIVSQSKYPSDFYTKQVLLQNQRINEIFKSNINELPSEKKIQESMVSLSISIDFDYLIEIEELPANTFCSSISELGENLGLFLGLSILSCFELVDLLMKISIIIFKKLFIVFKMKVLIIIYKLLSYTNSRNKKKAIQ